jgi:hypothetical protein
MPNILDLQGLPEGTRSMAARMMQSDGNCISVLSVVGSGIQASERDSSSKGRKASADVAGGNCISVLSVVTASEM